MTTASALMPGRTIVLACARPIGSSTAASCPRVRVSPSDRARQAARAKSPANCRPSVGAALSSNAALASSPGEPIAIPLGKVAAAETVVPAAPAAGVSVPPPPQATSARAAAKASGCGRRNGRRAERQLCMEASVLVDCAGCRRQGSSAHPGRS
jgi:hypothetical protein